MAILVHETSASLEQRAQLIGNFPRACDHFALNKFPDIESPEWMVLVRCLISMTQGISIPLNLRNFTLRSSHRYEKADQADRTIYSTQIPVGSRGLLHHKPLLRCKQTEDRTTFRRPTRHGSMLHQPCHREEAPRRQRYSRSRKI